jgi:RimJ/RimL family protein N-acetyltransferase
METPDPWPLWRLVLRTPRLELRPDDDPGLLELLAEACHGVHPPEEMPFGFPWTDVPPAEMVHNGIRFHWSERAAFTQDNWRMNFLIRLDGKVIGNQSMYATDFARTNEVSTGSWLGMRHQGKGFGTEMRAAILMLAFDHLGARTARSSAFTDNPRSLAVSRRLGYEPDGTFVQVRRGSAATQIRLLVTAERFAAHRPDWKLEVTGLADAAPMLGLPVT